MVPNWLVVSLVGLSLAEGGADPDTDGDGLSDYHEVHKYRTDPRRKDDPEQRREHTYSVRAVVRVMPPYNAKALTDDYQDGRVLAETKDYADLEIVAYPLNTNADTIRGNPTWRRDYAGMAEHLAPGVTTNWDAAMQQTLLAELARDGIDPAKLTDKEVVERVSRWLYNRSQHRNMFCTFFVHYPGGKPAVVPGLEKPFTGQKGRPEWSDAEQFAHELFGKEMFARKTYGTCTSAAVYQATVLRALGIPTRIILAIPLADASDPEQVALVQKGLTHHGVRLTASYGLLGGGQSFTSHTFLEVYVGHRWRRLNSTRLGQNLLEANYLGVMLKVHTFHDLSDANLAATWGTRFALGKRDAVFRHSNPYRALEVSDHFGRHANVPNPPAEKEHRHLTIGRVYWADSPDAPEMIRSLPKEGSPGSGRLFLHGEEWFADAGDYLQYKLFLQRADPKFVLRTPGHPDVKGEYSGGFYTHASQNVREMGFLLPPAEFAKMVKRVAYTLHPVNGTEYKWKVKDGVTVTRSLSLEEKLDAVLERLGRLEKRVEALEKRP